MTVNPLVAASLEGPKDPWAGVWIAEDIQLIGQGIRNGSWVDTSLGTVGAGLDGLAFVSDPVGSLLQYGVAWLIEHVKPLSEALDWLAGDPAQIAAHAQTWRNTAASVHGSATALRVAVGSDVTSWGGAAGPAYRAWAGEQQVAIDGLAKAAETMATITEGAGFLIAAVRYMVRDAIAVVVSRVIVYAAEEIFSLGLATPLVVEQVATTVAAWAAKIAGWLKALLASLRQLVPLIRRLGELIEELKSILRRLRERPGQSQRGDPFGHAAGHNPAVRNPAKLGPGMSNLRPSEQATAGRLLNDADFEGRTFTAAPQPDPGYDWVDDLNRTYDAMGDGTKSAYFDLKAFTDSVNHHLRKGNDFTIVDMTGYTPAQVAAVKQYVDNLPPAEQGKIIRVGF